MSEKRWQKNSKIYPPPPTMFLYMGSGEHDISKTSNSSVVHVALGVLKDDSGTKSIGKKLYLL